LYVGLCVTKRGVLWLYVQEWSDMQLIHKCCEKRQRIKHH